MPIYNNPEEIVGFWVGDKVYHEDCYETLEKPSTRAIYLHDTEREVFHCDKCGGRIPR